MLTVALVGPDGSGKSTLARRLARELPVAARYVYMGINLETSRAVLPTTRLVLEWKRLRGGRPDLAGTAAPVRGGLAHETRSLLRLAVLASEECFRQAIVWFHRLRGRVVLCDRHFLLDHRARTEGGTRRPVGRLERLHAFLLERLYPRPDLVVCLDAPAGVLFARKREGTLEGLERMRSSYLRLGDAREEFAVVDVAQPEDAVVERIAALVMARIDPARRLLDESRNSGSLGGS